MPPLDFTRKKKLPEKGNKSTLTQYTSTSQMAQDALELLDHVGWHDRVHLVGISMGGMISLEMVDADPFRFISLTLTSTTARRNIPTVSLNTLETFETQHSLVGCRLCLIKNRIYLS